MPSRSEQPEDQHAEPGGPGPPPQPPRHAGPRGGENRAGRPRAAVPFDPRRDRRDAREYADRGVVLYRLRQARDRRNYGQRTVAARIKRRQTYVSEVELGNRELTVPTLIAMARALDMDPGHFVAAPRLPLEERLHAACAAAYLDARQAGGTPPPVWHVIARVTGAAYRWRRVRDAGAGPGGAADTAEADTGDDAS